jgi:outer membrane receptor protein involved in Fe transport
MRHRLPLLAAVALLASSAALAQVTTGTIVGTVTDATGAVVTNAAVTVTNIDRNAVIRALKSNGVGEYVAALLPIGHYSVSVTAPGFKTFTKTGIELNVNDRIEVNANLQAGAVSDITTVVADALQVDTQSATASGLISGTQVRELALSARNYEEMVALTPGVSSAVTDTIFVGVETPGGGTNQVSFSINGARFSQNNWTVDGADNVDRGGNFSLLNYPSVDAIDEFKVLRSLYSPEYGRGAGGQINVITRSGGAKFHGGAYEFFRNDVLNANRYFNNREGLSRPPLRYNDFGWTLGGPVFIPGHYNKERNKTFFFYSEEIRRIVTYNTSVSTVPNAQERQGIFPNDVCTSGSGDTCTVLPAGTQLSSINPAAAAYLTDVFSKIPLPQEPDTDQLTQTARNVFNYRQEIIRVDHIFSPKLSVSARWINDSIPTINPAGLFGFTTVLGYATTNTNSPGRNLLLRGVMSFRPNLLNEIGYSYSYGAIVSHPIGFSNSSASPNVGAAITLPFKPIIARIPDLGFGIGAGLSAFGPYNDYNRNHNFLDNLTWITGKHTFRFGVTYHRYQKSENDAGGFTNTNGAFGFGTTGPDGQDSFQQEFANFLVGNVNSFQQSDTDFSAEIRQRMLELYAQDEYRLRPNLALTYGVRYTRYAQPFDANAHNTSFFPGAYSASAAAPLYAVVNENDPTVVSVQLCTVATAPCPNGLTPNPNFNPINGLIASSSNQDAIAAGATASPFGAVVVKERNLNFAPRFGLVWDPRGDGKTAVRTGYGLFFDAPAVGFVENNLFVNPPFVGNISVTNTVLDAPGSVSPDVNSSTRFLKGVAPGWKLPYTQSWSLDVQHELPKGIVLDVGYYGNSGAHLLGILDINQPAAGAYRSVPEALGGPIRESNFQLVDLVRPFPGYGPINESVTIFNSNYHALQVSMQKRFGAGSLISLNYTWSHALTNAGNDASSPQNNAALHAEYGPTDFDRRHIFTADFVYQLPWMKDQRGFVGHVLGGWEVSGIITFNSGLYLTPVGTNSSVDPAGLGLLDPAAPTDNLNFASAARPDQTGDPNSHAPHTVDQWFNTSVFATDAPEDGNRPGNARRGSIKGPGIQRWDLSFFKNFRLTEKTGLQLRIETFNIWNHTNFDGIDQGVSSETFGRVISAHEPRIMQLGLKFNF